MLPVGNKYKKLRLLWPNKRKYPYSAKTYKNPFFQNKRSRIGRGETSNKIKLAAFASVIVIGIIIWLLFFSTLFKIQTIAVSGSSQTLTNDAETMAWNIANDRLVGKDNLLLFNKGALSDALNGKYYLAELTIKRKLFHTLTINLREKQPVAIWQEDEKYYYLDGDGLIINQVDPLSLNSRDYPLIANQTDIKINDRQANINAETMNYITGLFNEFKDNQHGFAVERFIVDQDVNTVKMSVPGGPQIFFNTKADLAEQTAKLDLVIKEKLKDSFLAKEHIDLRYANNVYIK